MGSLIFVITISNVYALPPENLKPSIRITTKPFHVLTNHMVNFEYEFFVPSYLWRPGMTFHLRAFAILPNRTKLILWGSTIWFDKWVDNIVIMTFLPNGTFFIREGIWKYHYYYEWFISSPIKYKNWLTENFTLFIEIVKWDSEAGEWRSITNDSTEVFITNLENILTEQTVQRTRLNALELVVSEVQNLIQQIRNWLLILYENLPKGWKKIIPFPP